MLAAIDIQLRVTELGKHGRRHVMNVKYDERWPGACVMTISLGNARGAGASLSAMDAWLRDDDLQYMHTSQRTSLC